MLKANARPQNHYFRCGAPWKSENRKKLEILNFGQCLDYGNRPLGLVSTQAQVFWGSMSFIGISPTAECNSWLKDASLAIAAHEFGMKMVEIYPKIPVFRGVAIFNPCWNFACMFCSVLAIKFMFEFLISWITSRLLLKNNTG